MTIDRMLLDLNAANLRGLLFGAIILLTAAFFALSPSPVQAQFGDVPDDPSHGFDDLHCVRGMDWRTGKCLGSFDLPDTGPDSSDVPVNPGAQPDVEEDHPSYRFWDQQYILWQDYLRRKQWAWNYYRGELNRVNEIYNYRGCRWDGELDSYLYQLDEYIRSWGLRELPFSPSCYHN